MPIPIYLAMTAAEFSLCDPLPEKIGYMACHFSPYGTGLSNCPAHLPPGSILILNDRTPIHGHDPQQVADTLAQLAERFRCAGILLDLQRPGIPEAAQVVHTVCAASSCPVAVTEPYCAHSACGVFLTPPLHLPLESFLAPWQGREIWLEAAIETAEYVVTEQGCAVQPLPCPPQAFPHRDDHAFCRYHIAAEKDRIVFSLQRSREEIAAMQNFPGNVRCMVGLYQQLK